MAIILLNGGPVVFERVVSKLEALDYHTSMFIIHIEKFLLVASSSSYIVRNLINLLCTN